MNNNFTFPLLFTCIAALSFIIDVGQFFLLGTIIVPLLLCLYVTLLFYDVRKGPLITIGLLQCLESFCFYTYFFVPLIYLIPTTSIALYCKKNLYPSFAHVITFALIAALIQTYAVENLVSDGVLINIYTIMKINATIITTICFSLTINNWGMQGNRA
jgi:hypothetical protein